MYLVQNPKTHEWGPVTWILHSALYKQLPSKVITLSLLSLLSCAVQCLVSQSCLILCDPMDHSTPGFQSLTISQSLLRLMSIESVISSNHLILCHPLLLPPSIIPSIRIFSSDSVLRIRWSKYWSFSFSSQFFQWIFRTDFLYTFRIWELFFPPKRYFWSEVLFYHCY